MKNTLIIILVTLNVAALSVATWAILHKSNKIAYVRTVDLFNEFELKKSLASDFQQIENRRKQVLDSMKVDLTALENEILSSADKDEITLNEYKSNYAKLNQLNNRFSTETKEIEEKYNQQVWTQLNQYIADYGQEKGFTAILGAAGNGNLMYANSANDVTEELIDYANKRFSGAGNE